jgi:hypothetical protein
MSRTFTSRSRLSAVLLTIGLIAGVGATPTAIAVAPAADLAPVSADPAPASATPQKAQAPPRTPKPNLWLQMHAGPKSELTDATVVVTNDKGKVVGRGTTNAAGTLVMKVDSGASTKHPYLVRTSGGKVRGKKFTGHLELVVTKLGLAQGAQYVDLVTTIASSYVEAYGGTLAAAERKAFRKMGIKEDLGHGHLVIPTYEVHAPALMAHHRSKGGFDGTVAHLVRLMKQGKRFPSFATGSVEQLGGAASRAGTPRAFPNTACEAQTLPNPNADSPATVGIYGAMMAAGLVSVFATKDPSLLLNGVAGMVFANTPGMTNASMMASIQAQLTCISQQISMVAQTLSLQMSVQDAANCQANWVKPTWDRYYQPLINAAAQNPGVAAYSLDDTVNNASLQPTMDQIALMNSNCGDAINSGLFNTQGGVQAAWPTVLAQAREANSAALTPAALAQLQQFLQYWGNIEYQQSVMMNDWYNYQATVIERPQTTLQNAAWGGNCQKAPSLSDASANQEASTWCQWQQNIVDVWPGDIFSDEVADWDLRPVTSSSPYAISGSAVSAVPGGYGKSTSAWTENPRDLNPSTLGTSDLPNGTWKVSNALASYNNQPAQVLTAPYQRYDYRAAEKTFAPDKDDLSGYYDLHSFFIGALDATITDDTATPCTENCEPWTLIAADGKTELEPYPASDGPSCYDIYMPMPPSYAYQKRYVHNAVYSPKPWSTDTSGGYIGGETSSKNNNGSTVCSNQVPAFAWFLARPWVQGGSWPVAPAVTSPSTVMGDAQLTASGCPDAGCTWVMTANNTPGVTLSSDGKLDWDMSSSATSATITVSAQGEYQVSPETTLTVNLKLPPVITMPAYNQVASNAQLTAKYCPSTGCTWRLTGTVPAGLSISTSGRLSYTGTSTEPVDVQAIATNQFGSSPATYVNVNLGSAPPVVQAAGVYARNGLLVAVPAACSWTLVSTSVPGVNVNGMGYVIVGSGVGYTTADLTVTATDCDGETSEPADIQVNTKWYSPIITSSSVKNNATLVASGCPSGGCTWAFSDYTSTGQAAAPVPDGLTLSSDGTLSWSGTGTMPTSKVTVMAFVYPPPTGVMSAPVTLTVSSP